MVYFQTKNPNLGKFWRVLLWKILLYFITIWPAYFTAIGTILWPFDIFCGNLVYIPRFGILYQDKSGNPDRRWHLELHRMLKNGRMPFPGKCRRTICVTSTSTRLGKCGGKILRKKSLLFNPSSRLYKRPEGGGEGRGGRCIEGWGFDLALLCSDQKCLFVAS
jgi:hypothetical protein